jgi:bifunctional N-acetylglucosamine-1-phosphate-uridyltransferase/glucosamine-1-phosphate-acetyltransferase GlmU-like protein
MKFLIKFLLKFFNYPQLVRIPPIEMIRQLIIFLVVCLTFANAEIELLEAKMIQSKISTLGHDLPSRYCPMRNFDGKLFCPAVPQGQTLTSTLSMNENFGDEDEIVVIVEGDAPNQQKKTIPTPTQKKAENGPGIQSTTHSNPVLSGYGFDRVTKEIKFPGK